MRNRLLIISLTLLYSVHLSLSVDAAVDRDILSDAVSNVYTANTTAHAITTNMNFSDVSVNHWAKEPVTRLGALSVVKGYNEGNTLTYRPEDSVSNEEALAFLLRLVGQEESAVLAAQTIASEPEDPALAIWSRGYMQIASNLGLITATQLDEALILDQAELDPEFSWIRRDAVTREQVAVWLVKAVNATSPNTLNPINVHQQIFNLDDWESIDPLFLSYVEAVIEANIMVGDGKSFKPKAPLTRAEMAQIMINMEDVLYSTMDLTLKGGVIGSITESASVVNLGNQRLKKYLIRNDQGLVDQVDLVTIEDSRGRESSKDVPVLTANGVEGLDALEEGDAIQYIVDDTTKEMKYIYDKGISDPIRIVGKLLPLNEFSSGKIAIENSAGIHVTYQMIQGLYDDENQTIDISHVATPVSAAPVTNTVTLTIQNDLVTDIAYEGAMPLSMEVSGIVKEINTAFDFITIEDWNGGELTKYYQSGSVRVEKENYYDTEDEIGYIDEVFPTYGFDERDTDIEAIEVGDIVHLKLDPTDLQFVVSISAKTNYSVKFGEVADIADYGAEGLSLRIIYDDQSIGALEVASDLAVMYRGKNVGINGLKEGQLVKMLLNQAVLEPGRTIERVKQVDIDPYGNLAMKMYKGELGMYDPAKDSLSLLNSYSLSPVGWTDYQQMTPLKMSDNGVELYYDGDRISMAYADEYLRQDGMQVYAVTENHYDVERLSRMVFEQGRGDVLASTNISYTNGYDQIRLVSSSDTIDVDSGTIVVKHGHIVSPGSILSPDYAQVVMGDASSAVMVHVTQEPNNDALTVLRGRIDHIDTGERFNVESNAILKEMEWIYSPVEREFILSYDTVIVDENGIQPLDEFIDYSDLSKVDEVYTIIAEGTKATHLYKNPYATEGVVGTIYKTEGSTVSIRDAFVYASDSKLWEILSLTNNYADIELQTETVIIKNNEVIDSEHLEYGDKIRVLLTENLSEEVKLNDNRVVKGYIIFVE